MKISNKLPVWVWACAIVAAFASLYSIALRHKVEARNKAVAPALEFGVIADAAATSNIAIQPALVQLKASGLRAVVLPESTLGDLVLNGDASLDAFGRTTLVRVDLANAPRVEAALHRLAIPYRSKVEQQPSVATVFDVGPDFPGEVLREMSLGIDPSAAKQVTELGLVLIARHSNIPSVSLDYVRSILEDSKAQGAVGFLPQGDSVLGNRAHIAETMDILRSLGMYYCSPEFAKLSGETNMTIAGPDNTVRLHSIQAAEVEKMAPSEVVERFARAYSERNQRILLVRPFDAQGKDALESLSRSIAKIAQAVAKERGGIGNPRVWSEPGVPMWVLPLIALSILGVCAALALTLFESPLLRYGLVGAAALITVHAVLKHDGSYLATLGAMAFPVLAFVVLQQLQRWPVLGQLAVVSLVSLVGGLCVAGLLNGPAFYVRADTFFAVKLAHFLPILVVAWLVVEQHFDLRKVSQSAITWGSLFVFGATLAAFAFMLARTGNDNPAAVSGIELQFRAVLERFFSTRPRTKEFLIGHPAMVMGLLMAVHASKMADSETKTKIAGWSAMLVALGFIGQTSIVNTMCHLHTPVQVGLIRIMIGLIIGTIVGMVGWLLVRRLLPKEVAS